MPSSFLVIATEPITRSNTWLLARKNGGKKRFADVFVLHSWNNGALLGLNRVAEEEEEVLNTSYTYIYVWRELGIYSYALMFQAK
jgi:hypothetical protein